MLTIREETEKLVDSLVTVLGLPAEQSCNELIDAAKVDLHRCIQLAVSKMPLPEGMKAPVKIRLVKVPSLSDQRAAASIGIPNKLYYRSQIDTTLHIRQDCTQNPELFVGIILHELSHLFLWIIGSEYWNQEKLVDLTPMVMGFSDAVRMARKSVKDSSIGYLSAFEFEAADSYIERQRADLTNKNNTLQNKLP